MLKPNKSKVMVIGDIMLDEIVMGDVKRYAPNTIIPVLSYMTESSFLGGAANVYNNIKFHNVDCDLCGVIGNDRKGRKVKQLIGNTFDNAFILESEQVGTIVKRRYIDSNNQEFIRVDFEEDCLLQEDGYLKLLESIEKTIDEYSFIVISDYNKGFLVNGFISKVMQLARSNDVDIIVDTKNPQVQIFKGCFMLKINLNEFFKIIGKKISSTQEILIAADELKKSLELRYLIVTDSEKKIILLDEKNDKQIIAVNAVKVIDSTGAGDAFVSALVVSLLKNNNILDAIDSAKVFSSQVVQTIGTSIVTQPQSTEYTKKLSHKHLIDEHIERITKRYRVLGKKTVMVNGCFDVIHAGHIELLKYAKSSGDILIVALNSDNSIKNIKGDSRPINSISDRISIVDAINFVDHIVIFEEDDPRNVISKLRPDMIVKGSEYKNKALIEDDVVRQHNIGISYMDCTNDMSSSKIISLLGGERWI